MSYSLNDECRGDAAAAEPVARSAVARANWQTVLRVTSGNFLEMFDFFLFGLYATHIAAAFFPAKSEVASLMNTFLAFGVGFLMRPLGAIFLGAYIDKVGQRKGLVVTLGIMALGTILLALTPDFATIGLWAPALVVVGRSLQGLSAGVELGSVSVYLSEIAGRTNKGFVVSWQSASQQVSIIAAAAIGFGLNSYLPPAAVAQWGWRIPFFIGCAVVPFLFYIRSSLQETPLFKSVERHPTMPDVLRSLIADWPLVLSGMMMVSMTTVSFYLITIYTPTYGRTAFKLSESHSLIVTCLIALSNFVWLPVIGALSDRIGRKPVLVFFASLGLVSAYPALKWLASNPSFSHMLTAELWLSFVYAGYNAALVVTLTEIMPVKLRTTGFSLAYSLATAVFGGFTPAVCTWLIHVTHDQASPGLWMSAAAALALLALVARRNAPALQQRAASRPNMHLSENVS